MTDQPPPPSPPPVDLGASPPGWGAPPPGWGSPPPGWGSQPPGWGAPPPGWGSPPAGWGSPQPGWNPGFMPSQVGSGRFRSMSVGEWLDATFTLYRRNFALIASISAVVQIPYALLTWVLFTATGIDTFVRSPFASLGTRITQAQEQQLLNSYLGVLAVSIGLVLVSLLVVVPLGEAATTRAVSDRYLDRTSTLLSAYRAAWSRMGSLIVMILILIAAYGVSIAAVIAVAALLGAVGAGGLGALLAIVAIIALVPTLIVIYVRTVVAVPAIVLERASGWHGLQRSWQLIGGRFWATFGRMLLLGLIAAIISSVIGAIVQVPGMAIDPGNSFVFSQVGSAIAAVFVGPITYIGVTLLYYDVRIRKEGFDIEMLARSL